MPTKSVRDAEMNAATITEEARDAAKGLFHQQFCVVYSKMLAYERVGQMVGRSGSWVRQFIKGYADNTPNLVTGMSLIALYQRTCVRIEKDAERLEHAADARDRAMDKGLGEE